jgi:hypothetical protein
MQTTAPDPGRWTISTIAVRDFGNQPAGRHLRRQRNEGVGEHVRIRSHCRPLGPGEIADQRSAPNEENLFLLPDRFSEE